MGITIVTAHWKEDLEWLKKSKFPVVLIDKVGSAPSCFEPAAILENRGQAFTVYFHYIVENYENLPDHVAFIHGHEHSYHQMFDRPLLEVIESANIAKYGFISLNNLFRKYWFCNEVANVPGIKGLMLADHWCRLGLNPLPDWYPFNVPGGCQYIISKDRILRIRKEVWKMWLDILLNEENDADNFIWINVFENIIHFLLGERPDMEIQDDWMSFPYKVKWFHEIPQLCLPEPEWRAMGLEPLSETPSWMHLLTK
jgi:hypothetical protein